MNDHSNLAWLATGVVMGALAMASIRTPQAQAQAQAPIARPTWQFGKSSFNGLPTAWKLNTQTGEIRYCFFSGLTTPAHAGCVLAPDGQIVNSN